MSLAINWLRTQKGEDPMVYLDDVYRYVAVRLGNREDAEDIAIEVVQALPNPCRKANLRMYMLGMARRKVVDRLRRKRPTVALQEADIAIRFDRDSDEATLVNAVMQTLTDDHREVLTLKYYAGLSSAEIGAMLSKNPEAVDSMLQRARSAFEQSWRQVTGDEVKDERK